MSNFVMSTNVILLSAEVRPAPHMDNLVSIYKSMEAASGINIFVTQNLSSAKLSGKIIVHERGQKSISFSYYSFMTCNATYAMSWGEDVFIPSLPIIIKIRCEDCVRFFFYLPRWDYE